MALTQGARKKIQTFVQSAKALLIREFASQLQQHYGIRPDGSYVMVEELTTHNAAIMQTARLLRERLNYLEGTIAGENKTEEAVEQLVREQAFTILNRFAALRMAEERKIIPEAIKNGYQSEGFQVFDQLTGGAKTAEVFERYTWFLKANFDELAIDLPAVFDRFSPYALLFPSEKVLLELLKIIDDEDLSIYREEGQQPINLWAEDETIGWVYQYYNSRDEISAMREASSAPRNSRELAVRNQFFTPRYVVQFLVDNSLGRQWFEMTKGQTKLVDSCQYMVKRENEIFLAKGETIPEAKIEGANYIEYRALKDPRAILMLDPACGSMHFGLYCFDLYEQIYIEAWDNHPELMPDLRDKYLREDFLKQIPRLILECNIHGVDIDPRAIQIAGLSLWLRVQKSYNELGLLPADRPNITKSNLVVAEPMPGDVDILSDFTRSLPGPIGKLVRVIWEKMQLVGETGMLLKIEEELKKEIEIAKEEYKKYKNISSQTTLFDSSADSKAAEMAAIYGKDQKITKDFFDTAEEEVLKALKNFSENAEGDNAFQKLLFAEDTARGFAFIELCRKRYDVIVMNPPFGAGSISTEGYYKSEYPNWAKNILCCFFSRMSELQSPIGNIGAIFDRTVLIKSSYEDFRIENVIGKISSMLDTGWDVLDANVETSCLLLEFNKSSKNGVFIDVRDELKKNLLLLDVISKQNFILKLSKDFSELPNSIIGYDYSNYLINLFKNNKRLASISHGAKQGHALKSDKHFRNFYELKDFRHRKHLYNGYKFSMFLKPSRELTYYIGDGSFIREDKSLRYSSGDLQLLPGVAWGKRDNILDSHLLRPNHIFTVEGNAIPDLNRKEANKLLSYLNSSLAQYFLNTFCGQHKYSGYVNLLPIKIDKEGYHLLDQILALKSKWFSWDETTLEFRPFFLDLIHGKNEFSEFLELKIDELKNDQSTFERLVIENDKYWINHFECPRELVIQLEEFSSSRPKDFLTEIFSNGIISENGLAQEIFSNLIGICFKRWDISYFSGAREMPDSFGLYQDLPFISPIQLDHRHGIEFMETNELCLDLSELFSTEFTSAKKDLYEELEVALKFNSIEDYIINNNGFFDYHYNRYKQSRREAPIYWPLATKSGSYVIWLYYTALNDNTLFSIVNELMDPKIRDITKEIEILELNGSTNDLHNHKEFLTELEEFKHELLRVAQLPYKPNQNDGVLITAAPLHNLFTHSKWRKSTEACWKKLEKGEYDWAHLAYSIWPDRVTKKCKKDLSMAIAHGLESICEVKPKETKSRKKPKIKVKNQQKLL